MGSTKNGARMAILIAMCFAVAAFAAEKKSEFRYNVGAGANVSVVSEFGPVSIKPGPGRQVVITAITRSDKVEVDSTQIGNRVHTVTYFLQRIPEAEARVDYEVLVPQGASVTVRAPSGPITAEGLSGDLLLEGDAARVEVRDVSNAHVHVRTVNGSITLTNVSNGHVEISSVSGDVQLNGVSGSKVEVNTTRGSIRYDGGFGFSGDYSFSTHSGNIDVFLPSTASVDLTARSLNGSVEQDFPMQPRHSTFAITPGRSFAGTSDTGASSVKLRSFSGRIRVKKQ